MAKPTGCGAQASATGRLRALGETAPLRYGGPTHCPEPVAWRGGSWRAPNSRRYRIEACEGHRPAPVEGAATAT
jgi:hypothetical protein